MSEPIRATPRTVDSVRVLQVIETVSMRGAGNDTSPARIVVQYWSFDGVLLAENDPERPPLTPGPKKL